MSPHPVSYPPAWDRRGRGRPPKRPKEIGLRSDNGVLGNPKQVLRKPRTKVSTKPNKRYVASGSLDQSGRSGPVDGVEINGGGTVINHPSPVSNCPCCQPLSEIEVPGEIPNLDLLLRENLLVNFFKDIPDIKEFCKSCKK